MRKLYLLVAVLLSITAGAQTYSPIKTNWKDAGYKGIKPTITRTISIVSYGADTTGAVSSNTALANAVQALNGAPGIIFFPEGTYFFNATIPVNRDSIIFRGAGYDRTTLKFDLSGQVTNLIQITGGMGTDTTSLTTMASRASYSVTVNDAAAFHPADWVTLSMTDESFMTSAWAYGSLSQMMQIQSVNGHTITFSSPIRFSYELAHYPMIRKALPRNNIGIECLKIKREDATAGQASNIALDGAVNCYLSGIESDSANFAHVEINRSSNIEIVNSYFHDAFAYGGSGQGYGVLLQFGTNECRVEANYFNHLRHSMVLQAGANGNVLAYNYSTNPYWTEPGLPDSSAGDIVLHGNYPFLNLAEGNFVRNIIIDDSHGTNGPLNTFFRNRASGYGIFMNFNPATDSVQFIGNEITNNQIGLNFIQGTGHFIWGNNYRGNLINGVAGIPDASLYLPNGQKPSCPDGYGHWPVAGRVDAYNTGTIYAQARVLAGKLASCSCVPLNTTGISAINPVTDWILYPNPAQEEFTVKGSTNADFVEVYDGIGRLMLRAVHPAGNVVSIAALSSGLYFIRITENGRAAVQKLVKQ